jgi:hypothetical protein
VIGELPSVAVGMGVHVTVIDLLADEILVMLGAASGT